MCYIQRNTAKDDDRPLSTNHGGHNTAEYHFQNARGKKTCTLHLHSLHPCNIQHGDYS